ncbi:MAG: 23S rRNA (adenine(2030)-N(6))-methyltransferase RlmJ [Verrucomicrobia bacterium]|nr:MAG: 23S rRNA (adenine(2030)-N(6))-methyltransferase RlmJ [Verrucomicrobiota bacterium]
MNYRHIFHAGNFGDVFKHAVLVALVRAMQRKEKGFLFVDTHAGIGTYDLTSSRAERTAEYVDGIGRLWPREDLPPAVADYVEQVRAFNAEAGGPAGQVRHYPGSPMLAARLMRPQDALALSELHPDDFITLRDNFAGWRRVAIQRLDAYTALKAYLPPPQRRALVLIDPPYEDAREVDRLHAGLEAALERFPTGVYAIWYPIKRMREAIAFRERLQTLPLPAAVTAELTVRSEPADDAPAPLIGSGLALLNPPWQIEQTLTTILETLRPILAQDEAARTALVWLRERT